MTNPHCNVVSGNYFMQKIITIIVCCIWCLKVSAQPNITFAEYFVDNDPGFGNATSIPIVAFAVTGYSSVLLWRNCANRSVSAIPPNKGLLFHRNVQVIDIYYGTGAKKTNLN